MTEMTITYVLAGTIVACTFLNMFCWWHVAAQADKTREHLNYMLSVFREYDLEMAASDLEDHFRRRKNEEGVMLMQSARKILYNKLPRK